MKTKSPKVSLIIPVYNGADYVEEAIKSALSQTYKNLEIIIVNDGSKDNTDGICKKYEDKIKYIKKENGGVSTALNLAIKNMTGEYFSWLSHDDLYNPQKIEEEVSQIEENTIIMSDYNIIDENSNIKQNIIIPHEVIERHYEFALLKGYINGLSLLIPKKAFEEVGLFNENLRCTQDYDMWFRMLLKGYKFKHIPKVLVSTRIHSQQVTNTSPKMITEGNQLWIDMMKELPLDTKLKINKSEYNFYREMIKVLKETPYKGALEFAEIKLEKLKNIDIDLEKYKVSIIIPFYDEPITIVERSLNSILSQTHKNYEIIMINDNPSKYNEKEIFKLINQKNIIYIKNEKNLGVSASRNKGIKCASGEYIAFLDADDEFLNDKLEVQLKELVLTGEDFSHTSYKRIGKEKLIINSGKQDGDICKQCIYSCGIATPTVMIKKDFLTKYNLKYNEKIQIGEDTCFWLDILQLTNAIGIDIPLTNVYIDKESAAYNTEKQITGLKNIMTYVLNSERLNKYDFEIANLSKAYINMVLSFDTNNSDLLYEYNKIINSKSWKITKPLRLISKTLKTLKNEGIKLTIRKINNYIKLKKGEI